MHHVILLNWVNLCLALVKSLKQSFLAAENVVTISDPEVGRGTAKSYDFFSYWAVVMDSLPIPEWIALMKKHACRGI